MVTIVLVVISLQTERGEFIHGLDGISDLLPASPSKEDLQFLRVNLLEAGVGPRIQ